jgi:hypothetical protein
VETNRFTCSLFDSKRWTRNFEIGIRKALDIYYKGFPPDHIQVREEEESILSLPFEPRVRGKEVPSPSPSPSSSSSSSSPPPSSLSPTRTRPSTPSPSPLSSSAHQHKQEGAKVNEEVGEAEGLESSDKKGRRKLDDVLTLSKEKNSVFAEDTLTNLLNKLKTEQRQ